MKQLWNSFKVQKIGQANGKTILQIETDMTKDEVLRYKTDKGLSGEVKFDDPKVISGEQRKKIFATIKDVSLYTGYEAEYLRDLLTLSFCIDKNIEMFSLSNCGLEVAREYITWLIDFCISQGIPLSETALERTEDISAYLYTTIKHSICCICGDKGITYTLDREGNKMCLCDLHRDEAKLRTLSKFCKLYKVYGIKIGQRV